jgi:outer membrane lipoprotein-sorting protein
MMMTRAILLALMLTSGIACAAELDIDKLMHGLAQTRSDHASFVEKKSIAMLDKPVESSGELFYIAPDHLEKRTLKPRPESMILDGDTLTIERGNQKRRLQLQSYPELAAFIDSIRGTLAGEREALERSYQLSLEGTDEHWTLQLLPIDAKMQKVIKRIRIAGEKNTLHSIEIIQADGDSSVMLIEKMP